MERIENQPAEASTDERASPLDPAAAASPPDGDWPEFASRAEALAFWQGVKRGVRESGRDRAHPHMPESFSLDLVRDGAAPTLTSAKLLDPWPHIPDDQASEGLTTHGPAEPLAPHEGGGHPGGRADRRHGFTLAAEQLFLRTLADTGVVADACRAARVTRQAAYARRRSAAGRAFALAWEAAQLVARSAVCDDVLARARHGVIERVYRNGELVAERHRYDNRLTMAVLARLDRLAEGHGANAPVVRAVAQEFDQFLGLLPHDLAAAEEFVAARFPNPPPGGEEKAAAHRGRAGTAVVEEPRGAFRDRPPTGSEEALLARLGSYERYGAGLPVEIRIDDLDPERMESWTEEQFDRAEASGLLRSVAESKWPEAARREPADGADGMCKMRQLYLLHHPPRPPETETGDEDEDDFAGCGIWEEECGWMTDFPPPAGFDGHEEGEPGGWHYKRELAPEERALIAEEEALDREEDAARLAEMEAARRRFFCLDAQPDEPPAGNAG